MKKNALSLVILLYSACTFLNFNVVTAEELNPTSFTQTNQSLITKAGYSEKYWHPWNSDTLLFPVNIYEFNYAKFPNNISYDTASGTASVLEVYGVIYNSDLSEGSIDIWYTSDHGFSWGKREVMALQSKSIPYNATFVTINNENSDDPEDLIYCVMYQTLKKDEEDSTFYKDDELNISFSFPDTNYHSVIDNRIIKNEEIFYFQNVGHFAVVDSLICLYNTAIPNKEKNVQVGPSFLTTINSKTGIVNKSMLLPNYESEQITYWREDKSSKTVSQSYLDTDEEGNMYMFAINYLQPDHPSEGMTPLDRMRTPAFMKSTDGGETWSEWIKFPKQKIIEFLNEHDQDPEKDYKPFGDSLFQNKYGFAVTGVDRFTAVFPLLVKQNEEEKLIIADFSYNEGNWYDIDYIHEVSNEHKIPHLVRSSSEEKIDSLFYDDIDLEIEIAKIEGSHGSGLVIKFVDVRGMTDLDSSYKVKYYDGNYVIYKHLDSVQNFGIYGCYKDYRYWSNPVIMVDSPDRNEIHSSLPDIVESTYEVPLLWNLRYHTSDTTDYRYSYPSILFDIAHNWWSALFYGTHNLHEGAVEEITPVVSEVNMNVYPNPASANAYVEYTSGNDNVRMEIFDAMGNKVMSLINDDIQSAGTKTTPIDVTKLANGTYYVYLTVGNETFTKTLNVVR